MGKRIVAYKHAVIGTVCVKLKANRQNLPTSGSARAIRPTAKMAIAKKKFAVAPVATLVSNRPLVPR
jgi:hypothetical protein